MVQITRRSSGKREPAPHRRRSLRGFTVALLCTLGLESGCREVTVQEETEENRPLPLTAPCPATCLVITGMADGRTVVMDPTGASIRYGRGSGIPVPTVEAARGMTYLQADQVGYRLHVSEIDTRSGAIRASFTLGSEARGFGNAYVHRIAMTRDRSALVAVTSDWWGYRGVVRIPFDGGEPDAWNRIQTDGPILIAGGRGAIEAGTVVVVGWRRLLEPPSVYFLDAMLAIRDSIFLGGFGAYSTADMQFSPDESRLYVSLPPHLVRVDLAARRVDRAAVAATGFASVSTDGRRVFVTSPGSWHVAGSGVIREYTLDLTSHRDIDLRDPLAGPCPSSGGAGPGAWWCPTEVHQVVVAGDGVTAYALTGPVIVPGSVGNQGIVHALDLERGVVTGRFLLGVGVAFPSMYLLEPPRPASGARRDQPRLGRSLARNR